MTSPTPSLPWWSHLWRFLLILAISTVALGATLEASPALEDNVALMGADLLLGACGFVLVAFRRRWPLAVALTLTLFSAFSVVVSGPWTLAVCSLATHRRWWQMASVAVGSVAAELVLAGVHPSQSDPAWLNTLFTILGTGTVLATGAYTGARRELMATLQERAETAEREQASRVAQARSAERAAIAREMHDVLAHRMSLVAMHAGALHYRTDLTPEQTRASAALIRDNAHIALSELRDVLGVLRSDPAGAGDTAPLVPERPQPTLADLPELLADLAGLDTPAVLADRRPPGAALPTALSRHAYRILQEACTNAHKHAPGQQVSIVVAGRPGERLLLEVSNPLPTATHQPPPGAGLGLLGLAERAQIVGGVLSHGFTRDDRFRVRAELPWPATGEER